MFQHSIRVASCSLLLPLAILAPASAQCQTTWSPGGGVPGVDGTIYAMASWDPDGAGPQPRLLVLGGDFSIAGDRTAQCVAAFDPATGTWSSLGSGISGAVVSGLRPIVRSLLARANGDLVVGGWFTTAGGAPASCLARWNGSTWSPLGSGISGGGPYPADNSFGVRALAENAAGDLIVAGQFAAAGGVPSPNVARLTSTGWAALGSGIAGSGLNTRVNALALLPNGDLIAGGMFTLGNGLARWNGSAWSSFQGLGVNSELLAVHVRPNGELVIAGSPLNTVAGQPVSGIAAWNGATWNSLLGGFFFGSGTALATLANGDLVVAGEFGINGATPASNVARWDGTAWNAMGATPRSRNLDGGAVLALQCLLTDPSGTCWLGGRFHRAGNRGYASLARWDGTEWQAVGSGLNRAVRALLRHSDGSLWLGGDFTTLGAVTTGVSGVARLQGGTWSFLGGGVTGGDWSRVFDLCELPDGSVLAVGDFEAAGGVPARNAARWVGGTWQPFGSGLAEILNDAIERAWVQPGGIVWATGNLAIGSTSTGWATSSGGAWTMPPFGYTSMRLLASNGSRVAAYGRGGGQTGVHEWTGSWSFLGGVLPNQPFGPSGGVTNAIYEPNGDLLVAGYFTNIGGVPAENVARWRNGTWQALGGGLSSGYAPTRGLCLAPDGTVLAVRAEPDAVVRWNGSNWSALTGPLGGIHPTEPRLLTDGAEVRIGSQFSTGGGIISANLAVIRSNCAAQAATAGPGCPGSGGNNRLTASNLPWIGSRFELRGTELPSNALILALASLGTLTLPLASVLPEALPGCTLHVGADIAEALLPTGGTATWSFVIPPSAAFVGLSLWHQFLPFEFSGSTLFEVTATNAVHATLGVF
jgi:hypothetical protein